MRTHIIMHEQLPVVSAIIAVLFYLFLDHFANVLTSILGNYPMPLSISWARMFDATLLAAWAGFIGWGIKYLMDHHGKNWIDKLFNKIFKN